MARARDLAVHIDETGAKFRVGFFASREADDLHPGWQFAIDGEIVERGDKLAVREVAGGAKDHHRARLRSRAGDQVFAKGVHGY
jgi:hypothetical protein